MAVFGYSPYCMGFGVRPGHMCWLHTNQVCPSVQPYTSVTLLTLVHLTVSKHIRG
jgi:hypothetical protein